MNRSTSIPRPPLWRLLGLAIVISGLVVAMILTRGYWHWRLVYHYPLRYDLPFHPAIAKADRIVVRAGGFDCCGTVDNDKLLFTVTDPEEIKTVATRLRFQSITTTNSLNETCMCCGSPGIDWYRGNTRIALTAVQHGKSLRWRGFSTARILLFGPHIGYGDAPLTKESAEWLITWLDRHGVAGPKEEAKEQERRLELRARQAESKAASNSVDPTNTRSTARGSP